MIGNKYNKQKGQILLIVAMFFGMVLTAALSMSFTAITETQITKLEEESKKVLEAAEAGINFLLKQESEVKTIDIQSLPGLSNMTGEAVIDINAKKTFTTPLLKNGEQYTFYLANYDYSAANFNSAFSNYWLGYLDIYFTSQSDLCPALELIFIDKNNSFEKKLIDPCNKVENNTSNKIPTSTTQESFDEVNFAYKTQSSILISDIKLLIIRTLFNPVKIGFKAEKELPLQGKAIYSQAQSTGGVVKKIQFFQSYPQMPAEFFVTMF